MRIHLVILLWFCLWGLSFAEDRGEDKAADGDRFTFIRVQYDNTGGGWDYRGFRGSRGFGDRSGKRGGRGSWDTDYPAAELNFLRGVSRLTGIHTNNEPDVLRLDDDRIFEYPFLYMLEMGRNGGPKFNEKEIENLREYLLRGGFLLIDDFWGAWEWANFYRAFSRVLPEHQLVELNRDDQIFHSFYDIDGPQMIPGVGHFIQGLTGGNAGITVNRALLDDHGRIMVLINWNSDIGDGWEHTYNPYYPTIYANMAYQLGINFLIYALTH
jgi:hypothetical protein